jgi:hypothetical protein
MPSELSNLLEMVRARRQAIEAAGLPREIFIWDDDRDGGKQRIAAMVASGEAKAHDRVTVVGWRNPAKPAPVINHR